jgi:hypothetical protein
MLDEPLSFEQFKDTIVKKIMSLEGRPPESEIVDEYKYWTKFIYTSLIGLTYAEAEKLVNSMKVHHLSYEFSEVRSSLEKYKDFLNKFQIELTIPEPLNELIDEYRGLEQRTREIRKHSLHLAQMINHEFERRPNHFLLNSLKPYECDYLPLFQELKSKLNEYGSIDNLLRGLPTKEIRL